MSHGVKISNLPHSVTEDSIRQFLEKVTTDIHSIRIKGSTVKVFLEDEEEVYSVLMLDGSDLDGSTVLIEKLEGSSKSSSKKAKSKSSSDSEGKKKKSKSKEKEHEPEILATDVSHSSFVPTYEAPSSVNEAEVEAEAEAERERQEKKKRREQRRLRREAEKAEEAALLEANVELVESEVTEDSSKKEKKRRNREELKAEEPAIVESEPEMIESHAIEEIIFTEHVESKIQSDESREFRESSKKEKIKSKHEDVSVEVKHEVVESSEHVKVESSKHEIVEPPKHHKVSEKIEIHEKSHHEEKTLSHQHHGHSEQKSTKIESVDELKKALNGVSLHSRSHLPYNDSFKFVTEYNTATLIVLLALIVLTFSDLVN